ncbi:hypothetical protein NRY68_08165 [Acidithiobacillus ferrooxidans]|uniref:hypothetical protein n=1 Tax=Acidithiobacillus ferrooxidans TaxID=920 RepID=UPI002147D272|nr:hypothetical protein [Acidithiobacillus ferrooxidans]MCR1345774.1 hypothetical protein [Acidithiobacillus ferrooxidans]MCR1355694.1 hypothetical protein [Acidithiobacillus ferrooxidans]
MTVTKKDLADHLADIRGLNTRGNKQLVKPFFNMIRESFRRPAKWSGYPAWDQGSGKVLINSLIHHVSSRFGFAST